jgi:hypothetical protein
MSNHGRDWRRLVTALEASGLSRAEFCRRRRLSYHTMTYWVKRLGNVKGPGAGGGPASFVELSLPAVTAPLAVTTPAAYEVLLGNGRSIRLGPAFDDETLARLIRTVESC